MTEDEIVEEVEDARRSLQGKCPLRIDEVIVQLFDERNEAIAQVESLRAQVESLSKYPEVIDWEKFWNGAVPSEFYQEAAKRAYLIGRNYHPENSVRALFDYFYEYEDQDTYNKSYLDFRYNEIKPKLSSIFKEKQGEGKCTLPK